MIMYEIRNILTAKVAEEIAVGRMRLDDPDAFVQRVMDALDKPIDDNVYNTIAQTVVIVLEAVGIAFGLPSRRATAAADRDDDRLAAGTDPD